MTPDPTGTTPTGTGGTVDPTGSTVDPTASPPTGSTGPSTPSTPSTAPTTPDPATEPALRLCPPTATLAPILATAFTKFSDPPKGFSKAKISQRACAQCNAGDVKYAEGAKSLSALPIPSIGHVQCNNLCICNEINKCFHWTTPSQNAAALFIPACSRGQCDVYVTLPDTRTLPQDFGFVSEDGNQKWLVSDMKGRLQDYLLSPKSIKVRTISCGACARLDSTCKKVTRKRRDVHDSHSSSTEHFIKEISGEP